MNDRCEICRSLLDEEDLFCANCGTAVPSPATPHRPGDRVATCNFTCQGCGASMSYDASAQALRCPFCGSVDMTAAPDARVLSPQAVVPFAVDREKAVRSMRRWLGRGLWRPGALAREAAVVAMTPVYVPYWIFAAQTHTCWTADSSQTPADARADWYPMSGEHRGQYAGLLVGASGALTEAETRAICPFDLQRAVAPDQIDLENVTVEQFSVPRKYARPLAREGLESLEAEACRALVPGRARNVRVNVLLDGLTSQPLLVPVWIMAYRFQDRVFRFLVNGQTGRASGEAPVSWRKIALAVVAVIAAGLALLALL